MKLLYLLISATLLLEVDGFLFSWMSIGPQNKPKKLAPHERPIKEVRGYLRHKQTGLYLALPSTNGYVEFKKEKTPESYHIHYQHKDNYRLYNPHAGAIWTWPGGDSPIKGKEFKNPAQKNSVARERWTFLFHNGGLLIKFFAKGSCLGPKGHSATPGNKLVLGRCSLASFMFDIEDKTTRMNYGGKKRRQASYNGHSKRQASSYGRFRRQPSSYDHSKRQASSNDHSKRQAIINSRDGSSDSA